MKKFKWVEELISEYSQYIDTNVRNTEISFAYIRLNFAKGYYQKVLELIGTIKKTNLIYFTDASVFKLVALYELNRFEEAYKDITSIKND